MNMNLDEAIAQFKEDAKNNRVDLDFSFAEENEQIADWLTQLKEYKQLDADGKLLILPCKVGDTVYHVVQGRILEVENVDLFFLLLSVAEGRFGKTVFLTMEDAKQSLSELKKEECDYER